jgi:PTH1 family peptidyl-tRNA hydrolase
MLDVDSPIRVVAGLGNPGRKYIRTWHNLGFMVLDYWASRKNLEFKPGRGDYAYLEFPSPRGNITFIKPSSYMNLSGVPVAEIVRYRKLAPENTLVVCDDVALPLGVIRIRRTGSDGGHKGLASVIAHLGSENVPRMRLGIFIEGWRGDLKSYVLSRIPESLEDRVRRIVEVSAEALDCTLSDGMDAAMNRYNRDIFAVESADGETSNED